MTTMTERNVKKSITICYLFFVPTIAVLESSDIALIEFAESYLKYYYGVAIRFDAVFCAARDEKFAAGGS